MDIVTGIGDLICRQSGAVAGQLTSQGAEFLIPDATEPQGWQDTGGQPCPMVGLAGQAGGRQHTGDGAAILLTPQGDQLLTVYGIQLGKHRLLIPISQYLGEGLAPESPHPARILPGSQATLVNSRKPRMAALDYQSAQPGLVSRCGGDD